MDRNAAGEPKGIPESRGRPPAASAFGGIPAGALTDEMVSAIRSFQALENLYMSAAREITTKLENLNDEFRCTKDRNPIHTITTRIKTPQSIMDKLRRRGFPVDADSARENLNDIAGVRVICPYIDDIRLVAELLVSQDDVDLVRTADYIRSPKANGYRSLHLNVTVPVFLSDGAERVKVEIQIRTIAMDFWATLEHELAYKLAERNTEDVAEELRTCASVIADIDERMQNLHRLATGPGGPRRSLPPP